jgi:ATP/maltotriose-dependent transcriptional regulator MalT
MGTPTVQDALTAGHAALERGDWADARARFEEAGDSAEALEGLGRAAWWLGDEALTFESRERAHRAHLEAGDPCGAARMAMWIGSDNIDFRGDDAVAAAWLRRARSLLADHPPCLELGFAVLLEADIALLLHGDPETALPLAREGLEVGREIADPGVEAVAHALIGWTLITTGAIDEGFEHLDESGALAVGAESCDVAAPGWALCHTVSACANVGDLARATQWSRALHSYSTYWQARHFFGVCRTAYGGVLATRGDWPSAEEELRSAVDDLTTVRPALAAPGLVGLGELRVRQGEPGEARRLFESALPFPGAAIALGDLDLAAGDATSAAETAERVLRNIRDGSVLDRFPALELLARARATEGDAVGARASADEVEEAAATLGTPYMRGRGRLVRAEVLGAVGEHDEARRAAEDAIDLFGECSAPFEAARARERLAASLEALGRPDRARTEARAARDALAKLGARTGREESATEELSPRETDILRLVAQGMNNAQIAERLFLSPHTVHRHVANIRTKLRAPSRAAAVAYATKHNLL